MKTGHGNEHGERFEARGHFISRLSMIVCVELSAE